jgi:hypothetical protein
MSIPWHASAVAIVGSAHEPNTPLDKLRLNRVIGRAGQVDQGNPAERMASAASRSVGTMSLLW